MSTAEALSNDHNDQRARPPRRRRWLMAAGLVIGVAGALFAGRFWIAQQAEAMLLKDLAQRGIYLSHQGRSWLPWRGVHLEKATLHQDAAYNHPVVIFSGLDIEFPWHRIWKKESFSTVLKAQDALLELRDEVGAITFEHLNMKVVVESGELDFRVLQAQIGPLIFDLNGKVLTEQNPGKKGEGKKDLKLNLETLRSVFATVNVKPGTGPLTLKGTCMLNVREDPDQWQMDLTGDSKPLEWHGLPLQALKLQGRLSNAGLDLATTLQFPKGAAVLDVHMDGWQGVTLRLTGKVEDASGRADTVTGAYVPHTHTLEIAKLKGKADVLEFLHNIPALRPELPEHVRFRSLPELEVTGFSWRAQPESTWSMKSLVLQTAADISVPLGKHELDINRLKGSASYEEKAWSLEGMTGQLLGGEFDLDGTYASGALRKTKLSMKQIRLQRLEPWLGEKKESIEEATLALSYRGTLAASVKTLSGSGMLQIRNAPLVQVPVLDETYQFFEKLVPGVKRCRTGNLSAEFSVGEGLVEFSHFDAKGESVEVTASGTVNLAKDTVSAKARGSLRGALGVVTSPISHILEMQVSGPLNDIRVRPTGPVNIVSGVGKGAGSALKDTAETVGDVLHKGVRLPVRLFELLKGDDPEHGEKAARSEKKDSR